ncbi:MAG: N-acetyl-gamma-glutamyl-phosphate reductase [Eubacteriales bacterium]|nr:N-acetyl-gamma-glutamyl-phosphate reductase [Eubacteriales bacterium]MDD4389391.1 N-acetyl-gamma-glutamyl-phosphate reductase [Eubacteriales bacterium]
MHKIFIDGKEGTTGLRIYERLSSYEGIELMLLSEEKRKDPQARAEMINSSDITFLCLPDDAARESLALVKNEHTKVIDTSTAHRTSDAFTYGFPELSQHQREEIKGCKRLAVPGCHASGFIALIYPLVKLGVLDKASLMSFWSITGYSGGGKKMIADYEANDRSPALSAPRSYALSQSHKHLKEIKHMTSLTREPIFSPIVSDFYSGMLVSIPLFSEQLKGALTPKQISALYEEYYNDQKLLSVSPYEEGNGSSGANKLSGSDAMKIKVWGNEERITLTALYDNLGKGASGAAIQCMNLMLGFDETKGLCL